MNAAAWDSLLIPAAATPHPTLSIWVRLLDVITDWPPGWRSSGVSPPRTGPMPPLRLDEPWIAGGRRHVNDPRDRVTSETLVTTQSGTIVDKGEPIGSRRLTGAAVTIDGQPRSATSVGESWPLLFSNQTCASSSSSHGLLSGDTAGTGRRLPFLSETSPDVSFGFHCCGGRSSASQGATVTTLARTISRPPSPTINTISGFASPAQASAMTSSMGD